MALSDKLSTAKDVMSNTRSRMVVIILAVIVVIVMVIAFIKFQRSGQAPAGLGSAVSGTPDITSIPGLGQPTREYAKLQEQQNVQLATEAFRTGTSAIPTVVRTTYLDTGVSTDLSQGAGATSAEGCSVDDLTKARNSGVTAAELRCRGCSVAALKAAGFSAAELKAAGFSAADLKAAGFSAADLKAAGFSASELRNAGFSAEALKAAGFSAGELLNAGFSAEALKAAGFSAAEIKNNKPGACDVMKLQQAKNQGSSAADLKKLGCSAAALRAAGFSAAELKAAGFSAGELRNAGFSAEALKAAGFSAAELKSAGFSASELSKAGFTAEELLAAGYTKGDLVRAGIDTSSLDSTMGATLIKEVNSCSVESLKKSLASGKTAVAMKGLGCSAAALRAAGYDLGEIKASGFAAEDLQAAGMENDQQKAAKSAAKFSGLQDSLARMDEKELAGMTDQEMENFLRQQQAMMMVQANKLFTAWTPVPSQQYVVGEVLQDQNAGAAQTALTPEQKQQILLENSDIIKAGTIVFAVLDTGVNSDETSPVMATVIQGPLKGSKVIGNFQRVDKKVLLKFSVLSVPKLNNSIPINAVAVDPNTAKTALASDVDNHYMLRYGTLFASSFVSGLGQAFQTAGGQTESTTTGTLTTMPDLNPMQKIIVAFGNVGQQFGSAMASDVNKAPTVMVNAGVSIGLLLMADLAVPKDNSKAVQK